MYKLIALDIDGTLLDKNREISTATHKVLSALSKRYPVILISSRMPSAMYHIQKACGVVNQPIVAYNGGLVVHQHKVLAQTVIDTQTFRMMLDLNQSLDLHLSLFHHDEWFVPRNDHWTEREIRNTKVKPILESNEEVFNNWQEQNKFPHKIMCTGDENKVDEFYRRLYEIKHDQLHLYRSKPTYIEMAPRQISKLSGLKVLLDNLYPDIELEDIIAYGDNYNDIEMLKNVGLGVAVANAKDEVKAVADAITDTNIEDGVANHLQKIFQLKF